MTNRQYSTHVGTAGLHDVMTNDPRARFPSPYLWMIHTDRQPYRVCTCGCIFVSLLVDNWHVNMDRMVSSRTKPAAAATPHPPPPEPWPNESPGCVGCRASPTFLLHATANCESAKSPIG